MGPGHLTEPHVDGDHRVSFLQSLVNPSLPTTCSAELHFGGLQCSCSPFPPSACKGSTSWTFYCRPFHICHHRKDYELGDMCIILFFHIKQNLLNRAISPSLGWPVNMVVVVQAGEHDSSSVHRWRKAEAFAGIH